MTIVIIGTFDIPRVAELAACIRRRGFTVLALESMSLVALVMLTERVVTLVVYEDQVPGNWDDARERLSAICAATKILFVPNEDPRTAEQLACESVKAHEE